MGGSRRSWHRHRCRRALLDLRAVPARPGRARAQSPRHRTRIEPGAPDHAGAWRRRTGAQRAASGQHLHSIFADSPSCARRRGPGLAMKKRVLLIEDEESLLLSLTDRLISEGYEVQGGADGQTGYERALQGAVALIVLDVGLPRRDGFDVCRSLRQNGSTVPILMLTARGQLDDRVVGLK